jgi:hypothetical protein
MNPNTNANTNPNTSPSAPLTLVAAGALSPLAHHAGAKPAESPRELRIGLAGPKLPHVSSSA